MHFYKWHKGFFHEKNGKTGKTILNSIKHKNFSLSFFTCQREIEIYQAQICWEKLLITKNYSRVCVALFDNWMPFKSDKKWFLFNFESSFLFLRHLNFCPDFFDQVRKRLDKKAKINFKIYGVINWELIITITCLKQWNLFS